MTGGYDHTIRSFLSPTNPASPSSTSPSFALLSASHPSTSNTCSCLSFPSVPSRLISPGHRLDPLNMLAKIVLAPPTSTPGIPSQHLDQGALNQADCRDCLYVLHRSASSPPTACTTPIPRRDRHSQPIGQTNDKPANQRTSLCPALSTWRTRTRAGFGRFTAVNSLNP